MRKQALPPDRIRAVETGGCPHAAIREDVSANLSALEDLTKAIALRPPTPPPLPDHRNEPASNRTAARTTPWSPHTAPLLLCESGGDNLAADFSRELADLTLYVIDVAGGDKVPRKGGPGITQADLLIVNKCDLADAVGADLTVMKRDAETMRGTEAPTIFAAVKHGTGLPEIRDFILNNFERALSRSQHSPQLK